MNEAEKNVLREKIESEITKLSDDINELKEVVKPIPPENAIGRISRMDAINNKSVNEAALRKAITRLEALKYGLKNINNEEFGYCVRCKSEIPMGRLLLQPQSRSCVNCAY